ncbi:uncharacterized protein BX664DRAFT_60295 [Halteromyces radiatus]|uniref:uncharacterized protein n=1 Tax=Halteromyces radiatus TaxID=101107 RepID=UPI00221F3027|nr:uncharacterized protein BX664DRAFT_60295 [Halteromyces radiatus]KAI8096494.1 hypothetical protein BX664DRAFT_60295 [Halteromyces radiatus]
MSPSHDKQRSSSSTRILPESITKRKKILSFFSDRQSTTTVSGSISSLPKLTSSTSATSSHITTATTNSTTTISPLVRITLDNVDCHYLRKTLSKLSLTLLFCFRFQNKIKQRQDILSYHILPWFRKQQENATSGRLRSTDCDQARTILLQWWSTLMNHVQHINHTERSLYFECIVEIIGRSEFVAYDDTSLPFEHWYAPVENSTMATRSLLEEYKYLLMTTLRYAIDKLNYRAIYSNMISFCAKILALGFIKIPGLAITLLQTLPIRNTIMKRIIAELGDLNKHKDFRQNISSVFPRHLHSIMTWRPTQYNIHIQKPKQQQQKSPIASTGNWTRRWQSDDSELFFSFYRHYHVTLKTYVTAVYPTIYKYDLQERNTMLAVSPGYTYLAAYFAGKIDSLLHRRLHSVTTTLQQQPAQLHSSSTTTNSSCPINNHDNSGTGTMSNYTQRTGTTTTANIQGRQGSATTNAIDTSDAIFVEPGERFLSGSNLTANVHQSSVPLPSMLSSQMPDRQPGPSSVHQPTRKPLPLEMATQRYGECLVWCVMVSEPMGLFYDMINIWMRTMIKTTSMMAVESVY